MDKAKAIQFFGGVSATARALDISRQAVRKWRDPLTEKVQGRIMLALARQGRALDALMMAERNSDAR